MNVIAIDFETANYDSASACAIGLAFIERGKIARVEERYIRPPTRNFTFTWCHGLTYDDVRDAPEFPDVWNEFRFDLKDALLLAHNAAFDMNVIRSCLKHYGIKKPRHAYLCTLGIARAVWPELRSKSLASLARHLAISHRHHEAGDDARVCGEIAIAAAVDAGVPGIHHLPERLNMAPSRL